MVSFSASILEDKNMRETDTLVLGARSTCHRSSINTHWSFQGLIFSPCGLSQFKVLWLKSTPFLCIERPASLWVCVTLMSPVPNPYLHQFTLFSDTKTGLSETFPRTFVWRNAGKIMLTPRLGQRQGCEKHRSEFHSWNCHCISGCPWS